MIIGRVKESLGRQEEPHPWFSVCLVCVCDYQVTIGVPHHAAAAPPPLLSLGVGRAAEHLVHGLNDGVAVDAEDPEQLVRLAAARDLGHGQTVHGDTGLVHHGGAHGLTQAT